MQFLYYNVTCGNRLAIKWKTNTEIAIAEVYNNNINLLNEPKLLTYKETALNQNGYGTNG